MSSQIANMRKGRDFDDVLPLIAVIEFYVETLALIFQKKCYRKLRFMTNYFQQLVRDLERLQSVIFTFFVCSLSLL